MIKTEYSAITGETVEVVLSDEEIAEILKEQAEAQAEKEAKQAEAETKAQAKATAEGKLAALGLTTDDLRALGL
jgi:regulator of protease activity HflC (stomatin/prohibitin superfamily)